MVWLSTVRDGGRRPHNVPVTDFAVVPGGRTRQALPALGQALTVLGFAAAVLVVVLVAQARDWSALAPALLPLPWLVAAALALRARPGHPGALLFTGFGAGHLIGFALTQQLALDPTLGGWAAWSFNLAGTLCYLLGFCSLGAFLATYP